MKSQIPNHKSRLFFSFVFGLLILFSSTSVVFAHVLKVDGNIGVTTHIDPDDSPVAKKVSTIFVNINDGNKKFDEKNPADCLCMLRISKNGKVLSTLPITTGGKYNRLEYIFPTNGTYILQVSGKPTPIKSGQVGKGGTFQPFKTTVEYYVRSLDNSTIDKTNDLSIYFPYLVLVGGIIILFMFLNPFKKRHSHA